MCGIAGYLGKFDADLLPKMLKSIHHRGPDDNGQYYDASANVALGHTRLSIIDLSPLGHQPMIEENKAAMVFNGEIYNYQDIRQNLINKGYSFKGSSDSEVLLKAYIEYGKDCFAMLNGIFALAMWDLETRELHLVRDGVGIKPLYWTETKDGIIFSSEMKAIFNEKSIEKVIDPIAMAQYSTFLWTPGKRTMVQSVKKLDPGTILTISTDGSKKSQVFYTLPSAIPDHSISADDAVSMVHDAVETAVKRQLVSDVEVGSFLSGGLDSSSIVAFARKETDKRFQCFTMQYDVESDELENDLPYAKRVADYLDVDLNILQASPDMLDALPKIIHQLDEPQADPAVINTMMISEFARNQGIKVLLSGAGGDDLFTGYRRHYAQTLEKYWAWAPQSLRSLLKASTSLLPAGDHRTRKIKKAFNYADQSAENRIISYFFWQDPNNSIALLSDHMQESVNLGDVLEPMTSAMSDLDPQTPDLNKMLNLDMRFFLTDHNLNYTDKMSMAKGVEVRVPLLDLDLIELAAKIPTHLKQNKSVGKWVFKKAMETELPHDIIYRPKTGFGVPLREWMSGPFGQLIQDTFRSKSFIERGLYSPSAAQKLFDDTKAGKTDGTYPLLSIVCQELWCQQFID